MPVQGLTNGRSRRMFGSIFDTSPFSVFAVSLSVVELEVTLELIPGCSVRSESITLMLSNTIVATRCLWFGVPGGKYFDSLIL